MFFFAVCFGTSKSTWMCCATLIFCYEKENTAQNIASPFDNNMYLISDFRVYEIIIWTKDNVSLFHQLPCSIIWASLWNKQNRHENKAISVCHNCWCADKQQKMYYCFLILNTHICNVFDTGWQYLWNVTPKCLWTKKITKMSPKIACLLLLVGEIDECRIFEVLDCKYWKYT